MSPAAAIQPSGFNQTETCTKCGGTMRVTRRTPHPVVLLGEKQVITCQDCGAHNSRTVDSDGNLIA